MDKLNNLHLRIYLSTEYHIYLIIIQKHSIVLHFPLPQNTGENQTLQDIIGETCVFPRTKLV